MAQVSQVGTVDRGTDVDAGFDAVAHARSIVGETYRLADYYEVGREKVREYAAAVRATHPIHWDEAGALRHGYPALVCPPTFSSLIAAVVQRALTELLVSYNLGACVQTEQVLDLRRPVLAGDRLYSSIGLLSFRQAFGGDLLVLANTITNQRDEVVLISETSLIARSQPTIDTELNALIGNVLRTECAVGESAILPDPVLSRASEPAGEPLAAALVRSCADVAAGDELPSRTITLTLGDLVNYAGVAGDANPIHWHSGAAGMVGLERGVVAHGMLTMALGAGYLTDWLGDPAALRVYSVRFTSPVYVTDTPSEIVFSGRIKSVDPETRTAVVALTATHDGRKIFGRAVATVLLL
ncbi:fused (3R)-hydroxyacyl-ACP dehydratase subunits HadA/HadB [Nocardia sp. NPDC051832]|uniref:fused (3R)-hydroxyacyl-ACP dehydratase subunits HadA/HadB n=1 Tax=Nocardia sp. NPDC051832 TaxID=3155673 RepID=UPI00342D2FE4